MKKGAFKVAGRFVHDNDRRFRGLGVTVWQKGDVCVARLETGEECRAQISYHGCGHWSIQCFRDGEDKAFFDINTSFPSYGGIEHAISG